MFLLYIKASIIIYLIILTLSIFTHIHPFFSSDREVFLSCHSFHVSFLSAHLALRLKTFESERCCRTEIKHSMVPSCNALRHFDGSKKVNAKGRFDKRTAAACFKIRLAASNLLAVTFHLTTNGTDSRNHRQRLCTRSCTDDSRLVAQACVIASKKTARGTTSRSACVSKSAELSSWRPRKSPESWIV